MDEMMHAMVAAFEDAKSPYVLIGGIAASLLGKPRMTMDSDVVVVLSSEQTADFVQAMKKHGFSVTAGSKPKMIARLQRGLPVKFRFGKRFSVDVRIASYSLDHNALRRAKRRTLFERKLPIVSVEDLIVYKLVRFNALDQSDIDAVLTRHEKNLDREYLAKATRTLAEEIGDDRVIKNLSEVLATA